MPPCFSAAGSALGRGEVGSSALLGFLLEGLVSSPSGWGEGLLPAQPGVCVGGGGAEAGPATHAPPGRAPSSLSSALAKEGTETSATARPLFPFIVSALK